MTSGPRILSQTFFLSLLAIATIHGITPSAVGVGSSDTTEATISAGAPAFCTAQKKAENTSYEALASKLPPHALECAQNHFYALGKPMHPSLVARFVHLESLVPETVSLDVLAAQESALSPVTLGPATPYGKVTVTAHNPPPRDTPASYSGVDNGFQSYTLIGKLANGYNVVLLATSGGGTGVFYSLVIVAIDVVPFFAAIKPSTLEHPPRLQMTFLGAIPLGDRSSPEVRLKGNTLFLRTTDRLSGKKSEESFTF